MAHEARRPTILIVDDQAANIKMLAECLNKDGYRILAATNGEEALTVAAERRPDLILLDIQMPGMDGYEVCRRLKAQEGSSNTPVIFVTVLDEEGDESQGLALGAVDYVTRPFSMPIVRARVRGQLRLKRHHDELQSLNRELQREMAERKRAEEAVRQAQKMEAVATLAGGVAHHFNNILSIILGFADLSREQLPEGNAARRYMEKIAGGVARARDLVIQLLEFSRQAEQTDAVALVGPVVLDAVTSLENDVGDDVRIETSVQDDTHGVHADSRRLRQMVMNLMVNAVQAMPGKGGLLSVSVESARLGQEAAARLGIDAGSYILLSVCDTGEGIPAENLEHVFEPFFTTREIGKGVGLGLALVHGFVVSHRGAIDIDSEPGIGTVVNVYLPWDGGGDVLGSS